MRRCAIALAALLAGCVSGPVDVLHKTGSSLPERQLAADECRIAGLQQVPESTQIHSNPGYYNPGTLQCSSIGNYTTCNRVGAVNIPASVTTSDANQGLRNRFIQRCLAAKGYGIVQRPICRTRQESAAYQAVRNNQPPAEQIACVPNDPI